MILNVIFSYNVNEQTGEMTLLSKKEVTVDTTETPKKTTKKVDNNSEPIVTLESNKLILSKGAAELLEVYDDCRINVEYNKNHQPIIGTGKAFGNEDKGNKLTKSNTVSYRGAANEKLSKYGAVFKLEASDSEGLFLLIGDKEPVVMEVPDEIIDINDDLDLLNLEDDNTELGKFDFKL